MTSVTVYQTWRSAIVKRCNTNIRETLNLVDRMLDLANQGDVDREDTGCGILFGYMRDAAYKIKKLAEEEKNKHMAKGWWVSSRKK